MGRSALDAIFQSVTIMDSSPRRETITRPVTNTWSPRSTRDFHSDGTPRQPQPATASPGCATLGTTPAGSQSTAYRCYGPEHHAATNMHHTVSLVASLQLLSSQLRIVLGAQILNVVGLHAVTLRIQQTHRVCLATRLNQLRTLSRRICICSDISAIAGAAVCSSAHSDTYLCSVLGTLLNERTLSAGPCCQSGGSGQRTQQPVPALAPTPQSAHRKSSGSTSSR